MLHLVAPPHLLPPTSFPLLKTPQHLLPHRARASPPPAAAAAVLVLLPQVGREPVQQLLLLADLLLQPEGGGTAHTAFSDPSQPGCNVPQPLPHARLGSSACTRQHQCMCLLPHITEEQRNPGHFSHAKLCAHTPMLSCASSWHCRQRQECAGQNPTHLAIWCCSCSCSLASNRASPCSQPHMTHNTCGCQHTQAQGTFRAKVGGSTDTLSHKHAPSLPHTQRECSQHPVTPYPPTCSLCCAMMLPSRLAVDML